MAERKIIVMFPTWGEAGPFMSRHAAEVEIWQCGIGPTECAARTAAVIAARKPDLLVLAGTAGAHPDSGLAKGSTVMVAQENLADLGAVREAAFHPLPKTGSDPSLNFYRNCTLLPDIFPQVISDTVSTAGTPFRNHGFHAAIENMEGAAFFAVCALAGIPYAELRCISNYCGEERKEWILEEASDILAADLSLFIEKLRRQ